MKVCPFEILCVSVGSSDRSISRICKDNKNSGFFETLAL